MATRLNTTNFGYQNFYSAVLTADITSGSLTISVDTVPSPSSGILVIDPDSSTSREVILYTSKGASTVTCPSDGRGYSSSTAAAHLTGTTVIMAPIDKWFTALASGELSTDPMRTEFFANGVTSGLIWTGDSLGSTRLASMTSGVLYILGRRVTSVAVTSRTFTASKDTYVDLSDATSDGTATITYTEVANGAASPSLAANSVRIAKIVTGVSSIAAASSITQPGNDSLGNIIYPKGPIPTNLIQNPYKFSVYRNAAANTGNNSFGLITFDTKEFDTGNNYSTSTGKFVAPVDGYYQFNFGSGFTASAGFCVLALFKNGAECKRGAEWVSAGSTDTELTGSAFIQLEAADEIQVYVQSPAANALQVGSGIRNYFNGFLASAS